MRQLSTYLSAVFTILSLLFYTGTLKFASLFSTYDGISGTYTVVTQPLAPILSALQHLIFLIAFCLLILRWRVVIKAITRNLFLWALVAVVLVSFTWSDFSDLTLRRSAAFLETTVFGLFFATSYSLKSQVRLLACALGLSVIVNIVFSKLQPYYAIDWIIHPGAWKGVFVQKNILARLAVLACLSFLLIDTKQKLYKYLSYFFTVLGVSLIILSQSKSALVIFCILLSLLFFVKTFYLSDIVLIPLILSIILATTSFLWWLTSNLQNILQSFGRDATFSGRTVIWSAVWEKIQERPLLGYGYRGFWQGIYGDSSYVGKVMGNTYTPPHAHNGFLDLVLSFGLVGALIFTLSFLVVSRKAIIAAIFRNRLEDLFPLSYIVFLVLYNLIESTLVKHNSIFWILYVSLASTQFLELKETLKNTVEPDPLLPNTLYRSNPELTREAQQ